MSTQPVKPLIIAAFVLFGNSLLAADYDDGRGRLWRQPVQTLGLSWNQVQASCSTDGVTPCGGSLQGWTWATQQQTIDLFNQFLPPTHQLTVENPGVEAYVESPFAYTTVFAMNGAPYSFFNAVRGWTSTLDSEGLGIRGTISDGGGPVSFYASIGVNDPLGVSEAPGYLNETGIWLWKYVLDLPADFNNDRTVDAADYVKWRDNLGSANPLPNEMMSPGIVDGQDYDHWRSHFGQTGSEAGADLLGATGSASAAIPEPAGVVLAALAIVIASLADFSIARVRFARSVDRKPTLGL